MEQVMHESIGCRGDWTNNNDCCGICAVHKNDHWFATTTCPVCTLVSHFVKLSSYSYGFGGDGMEFQEIRNQYWAWLHEFKNNHGYLDRSHNYSNFLLFLEVNEITLPGNYDTTQVWNWYFC